MQKVNKYRLLADLGKVFLNHSIFKIFYLFMSSTEVSVLEYQCSSGEGDPRRTKYFKQKIKNIF